jgi:hypothetical protein
MTAISNSQIFYGERGMDLKDFITYIKCHKLKGRIYDKLC